MTSATEKPKRCPFCGSKAATRHKVESSFRVHKPDEIDLEYYPRFKYDPCYTGHHRFGYQAYCTGCYAKTPYVWSDWHDEGIEWKDNDKFGYWLSLKPDERDAIRKKAIELWDRRVDDDR